MGCVAKVKAPAGHVLSRVVVSRRTNRKADRGLTCEKRGMIRECTCTNVGRSPYNMSNGVLEVPADTDPDWREAAATALHGGPIPRAAL